LAAGSAIALVGVADEVEAALEELVASLLDASVEESLEHAAAPKTARALRPAAATALR
jgi:hypothetical protein